MKSSRLFISLIFISLLFVQCKKDEKRTIVKVSVIDKTTNLPVDSARVFLVAYSSSGFMGPSYSNLVEEKRTDKMGQCTFDFMADRAGTYLCYCSAENYYDQDEENGSVDFSCVNYVALTMLPRPAAYLKLYVKNTLPFDDTDKIFVSSDDINLEEYFYGASVDTFIIRKALGNFHLNLKWQITKNGTIHDHSVYFYISEKDTTTYSIDY